MESFCPKCRILIFPKVENEEIFIECTNCGFRKRFDDWTEHDCTNCNYNKAIVILHEMVRGDEGTTTMYRCLKCGATDKEGWSGR